MVRIDTLTQISSFKTAYKEGRLNCLSQAGPAEGMMGIGPADAEASYLDVVPLHLELFAYKANRKAQTFLSRPWQRGTWKTDAFLISWFSLSVLHSPGQESLGQQIGRPVNPLPLSTSPALPGGSALPFSRAQDPSIHFSLYIFFECGLHVFHVVVKKQKILVGSASMVELESDSLLAHSVPVSYRQCSQPGR